MTERERLMRLMIDAKRNDPETKPWSEWLVDYLLDHGVIVPLCDIGNEFFFIHKNKIHNSRCHALTRDLLNNLLVIDDNNEYYIADCVFSTREEAEDALKECMSRNDRKRAPR